MIKKIDKIKFMSIRTSPKGKNIDNPVQGDSRSAGLLKFSPFGEVPNGINLILSIFLIIKNHGSDIFRAFRAFVLYKFFICTDATHCVSTAVQPLPNEGKPLGLHRSVEKLHLCAFRAGCCPALKKP